MFVGPLDCERAADERPEETAEHEPDGRDDGEPGSEAQAEGQRRERQTDKRARDPSDDAAERRTAQSVSRNRRWSGGNMIRLFSHLSRDRCQRIKPVPQSDVALAYA